MVHRSSLNDLEQTGSTTETISGRVVALTVINQHQGKKKI